MHGFLKRPQINSCILKHLSHSEIMVLWEKTTFCPHNCPINCLLHDARATFDKFIRRQVKNPSG